MKALQVFAEMQTMMASKSDAEYAAWLEETAKEMEDDDDLNTAMGSVFFREMARRMRNLLAELDGLRARSRPEEER